MPQPMTAPSNALTTSPASDASSATWLSAIGSHGVIKVFPARTIFINEGDQGDTLYVIREGHGKIFSSNGAGKEIVFATYGPGDTLGEPSLDGGLRSASVMSLERTTCLIVKSDFVLSLITEQPKLALPIIHNLIKLVRSSSENVKSLALEDVYGRVVRLLMKAAEPVGDAGWVVNERMTQQNIADRVGSSREMVSRIFKDLERGGYLSVEDKRIAIHRKPPPGW